MTRPHDISLPPTQPQTLGQDEAFFILHEGGQQRKIRFHDYEEIYRWPGLYEQLFYQRLMCLSPTVARDAFLKVLSANDADIHQLRVLDLGAGNGMVGELLEAARVIGVDISESARAACQRDRPHAYDAYHVVDMTQPPRSIMVALEEWRIDCMTCISALGFGDIPVRAFGNAFNLVADDGWVVFNIKDTFLGTDDKSGFARLVRHLMHAGVLHVHHLERYRHRLSIDGQPLYYYLLVGRKMRRIALEEMDGRESGHSPTH